MVIVVRILLLLVISTMSYGRRLSQNDPGSTLYDDTDYPIDEEIENDPGSAMRDVIFDMDFPFDAENDPGSA